MIVLAHFHYLKTEKNFNKSLDIDKRLKTKDNLPDVYIDGKNHEYEHKRKVVDTKAYHLVKLPIDDPRAYILGRITDCCQSVGGHSEQCVIDVATVYRTGELT